MGSQSVTNFSAVRMKRIHDLVKDYSPRGSGVAGQVREIGAAEVGTLEKPEYGFAQTLSNPSIERALALLMTLKDEMQKNPQAIYQVSGVGAKRTPVLGVSAFLKRAHNGLLTKAQAQTDSAFAANDAIPKTIINIVSHAYPREREPVDVDPKRFEKAIKEATQEEITTAFMQNVTAALIDMVLDATRGKLPPARVNEVKEKVREHFIPEFIERLMSGK